MMPSLVAPQFVASDSKIISAAADDRPPGGAETADQRRQLQLDRLAEAERGLWVDRLIELHIQPAGERGHRGADQQSQQLGAEHANASGGRGHLVVAHRVHLQPEAAARIQRVIQ